MKRLIVIAALLLGSSAAVLAQSVYNPFTGKIDFISLPTAGTGTVTEVTLVGTSRQVHLVGTCDITTGGTCAFSLPSDLLLPIGTAFTSSTTSAPSFNIASGVSPTTPVSGDFWNLSGALKFHDGTAVRTILTDHDPVVTGTLTIGTTLLTNAEYDNGTCTTAATISPLNGNRQKVLLTNAQTCALTFTQPTAGTTVSIQLKVIQSAAGAFNGAISGGKWPLAITPTITPTSGAVDFISCYLDGTNAYCVPSQDFR